MKITKKQRALMEHTVSGHDRNWFGTGLETNDSKCFQELVAAGLATAETPPKWMGDDVIYRLTQAGKDALK